MMRLLTLCRCALKDFTVNQESQPSSHAQQAPSQMAQA